MKIDSLVSADWLHQHIDLPELIVLDATVAKPMSTTKPLENAELRIPGARFFDIDHAFSDIETDLPHMMCNAVQFQSEVRKLGIKQDSIIIVYDQHGIYSSPRAWWMLRSMGHTNVAVLDGGLPAWIGDGFLTEDKSKKNSEDCGDFIARFDNSCFVNAEFLLSTIEKENVQLLDARSKGRFDGMEPEPRDGLRGGHVPNSISLPFSDVLDQTCMKSKQELKEIFKPMNLENSDLVFSCGSGLTACIILFAAHLVGHERLAVYDGSWAEWGQKDELPLVK